MKIRHRRISPVLGMLAALLCAVFFGCSRNANNPSGENVNGSERGAIVGMFEVQVITWGDPLEGNHKAGITLTLINTITLNEHKTPVVDGWYKFSGLDEGHYRIEHARLNKDGYSTGLILSEYMFVKNATITIAPRLKFYSGIRLKSFDDKGINNKRTMLSYPESQPDFYIETTFKDRPEIKYQKRFQ